MRPNRLSDCYASDGRIIRDGDFVRVFCQGEIIQGTVAEDDNDVWFVANVTGGWSPSLWTCDRVDIIRRDKR